jgi:hypothetical protein
MHSLVTSAHRTEIQLLEAVCAVVNVIAYGHSLRLLDLIGTSSIISTMVLYL